MRSRSQAVHRGSAFPELEGESAAWVMFGVAAVWLALTIWLALRAPTPPQLSDESRRRYFAPLRHAGYQPLEDTDDEAKSDATSGRP